MTDKSTTASYVSSIITAGYGALTFNEWVALAGLLFAIATFAVNLHYQRKRDQREETLFSLRYNQHEQTDKPN